MQTFGRYEILSELGRGAMGTVYQARDPRINRTVAIKTISISGASPQEEADYLQRFFREAQAAGKLAHPGIVTIFDVGEEESGNIPYIVMEYISGTTLEELGKSSPPPATVLDMCRQVAEALHYAHSQGIVHRDVKPANIILTEDGRAKIMDFGIAKMALTDFTVAGQVLGTPSYMSPEQLTGDKAIDGRSDLFSLGVVLYYLLTGTKPFTGDSVTEITFKVVYKEPMPASQINLALHGGYDYVLGRALAKSPSHRYENGSQFAADLYDLQQGLAPRSKATLTANSDGEAAIAGDPTVAMGSASFTALHPGVESATPVISPKRTAAASHSKRTHAVFIAVAVLLVAVVLIFARFHCQKPLPDAAISALETSPAAETSAIPAGDSSLRVRGSHPFYRGELSLWLDGKLLQNSTLRGGGMKKKYHFLKTPVLGTFDETLAVPPGDHKVRVQVSSSDGFVQAQEIEGNFSPDLQKTLRVAVSRGRGLNLEWSY